MASNDERNDLKTEHATWPTLTGTTPEWQTDGGNPQEEQPGGSTNDSELLQRDQWVGGGEGATRLEDSSTPKQE